MKGKTEQLIWSPSPSLSDRSSLCYANPCDNPFGLSGERCILTVKMLTFSCESAGKVNCCRKYALHMSGKNYRCQSPGMSVHTKKPFQKLNSTMPLSGSVEVNAISIVEYGPIGAKQTEQRTNEKWTGGGS